MEDITLEPPADGEVVDPATWFDTFGPLELEIGCGKGGFLLSRARTRPDIRMLGIEWANKYFRYCADRMARRQLTNVRVMRTDAAHFLRNHLPPECVTVLHLYHPDPWPKKRHHKRRLVQPDFVQAVVRVLTGDGKWLIQSDHQEYFAAMREVIDARPELTELSWDKTDVELGGDWIGTNFEVKYTREGRTIYRVAYAKSRSA